MRIVILHGFNSSSVVDPESDEASRYGYMGGEEMRKQIDNADVIIGVWPPDDVAVVLQAPPSVTIECVTFPHAKPPELHGSITAQAFQAKIQEESKL